MASSWSFILRLYQQSKRRRLVRLQDLVVIRMKYQVFQGVTPFRLAHIHRKFGACVRIYTALCPRHRAANCTVVTEMYDAELPTVKGSTAISRPLHKFIVPYCPCLSYSQASLIRIFPFICRPMYRMFSKIPAPLQHVS